MQRLKRSLPSFSTKSWNFWKSKRPNTWLIRANARTECAKNPATFLTASRRRMKAQMASTASFLVRYQFAAKRLLKKERNKTYSDLKKFTRTDYKLGLWFNLSRLSMESRQTKNVTLIPSVWVFFPLFYLFGICCKLRWTNFMLSNFLQSDSIMN